MRRHAAWLVLVLGASCGDDTTMQGDAAPSAWRLGPKIPARRLEPGVTALGTQLVVLGGFDTGVSEGLHITDAVDVFDTETETWGPPLPPAPVQWSHIDLASNGTTLFLLGGLEGEQFIARGDAWALDAGASAWRPLARLPAGLERGAAGVVSAPGHIYLLGGASTTDALATCLDYDIANDSWTQLPALPGPRSHPAAMRTPDGTLLVAAGLRTIDSTKPLSDVLALPPGGTAWEPRTATLLVPRGGCAYGALADQLICVGGESGNSALRGADLYDASLDRWSSLELLPVNRAGTQGAAVGTRFYVPGGAPALAYLPTDTLYIYSPP
ncbi:MAG TPA: kelch repeat-containing protein [Kofleriaceae bacterium]|nr:kelch repeat-containing protein [Kofleriaceae bacterium]